MGQEIDVVIIFTMLFAIHNLAFAFFNANSPLRKWNITIWLLMIVGLFGKNVLNIPILRFSTLASIILFLLMSLSWLHWKFLKGGTN